MYHDLIAQRVKRDCNYKAGNVDHRVRKDTTVTAVSAPSVISRVKHAQVHVETSVLVAHKVGNWLPVSAIQNARRGSLNQILAVKNAIIIAVLAKVKALLSALPVQLIQC